MTLSENPAENIALSEIKTESENFHLLAEYFYRFFTKGHGEFAKKLADQISDFYMNNVDHSISTLFTKGMTASEEDPFDAKVFESDKQIEAIAIEYFSEDTKKAIAE